MERSSMVAGVFVCLIGCADPGASLVEIAHAPYRNCVETWSSDNYGMRTDTTTYYDEYGWISSMEILRDGERVDYSATEYFREQGVVRRAEVNTWSEYEGRGEGVFLYDEHGHFEESTEYIAMGTSEAEGLVDYCELEHDGSLLTKSCGVTLDACENPIDDAYTYEGHCQPLVRTREYHTERSEYGQSFFTNSIQQTFYDEGLPQQTVSLRSGLDPRPFVSQSTFDFQWDCEGN